MGCHDVEKKPRVLLGGLAAGAGLMYLLDPHAGPRRRALLRDKLVHAGKELGDLIDKASRDFRHRFIGLVHRVYGRSKYVDTSEGLLVQRIRSEMGRRISHPHAIDVLARDGEVTLRGAILEREVSGLLRCVRRVQGVHTVADELSAYKESNGIPSLQGEPRRRTGQPRVDLLQENWSPATRLATGTFGVAFALYGLRRGGPVGALSIALGSALLVRASTNLPARRLLGIHAGHRAVDFHKTIIVHAPIATVFEVLSRPERFPLFMEHVREVHALDGQRSRWKVSGPVGLPVEWEAEITKRVPNRMLAWKTTPGSIVEHAGIVHFEEAPHGATRLDIQMSYNPPGGAIGHTAASLFRKDPKAAMDDDLVRLKSLLEEGKSSAKGVRVTLDQLLPHEQIPVARHQQAPGKQPAQS